MDTIKRIPHNECRRLWCIHFSQTLLRIFAKYGFADSVPEPTHIAKPARPDCSTILRSGSLCVMFFDFEDEGKSIFSREKPLSEKTLERIYAGLIKFVAGGKSAFMVKYNSVNQKTGKICASLS